MPVGTIKIKFGKCLTGRNKTFHRDLREAARQANKCRIAAFMGWEDRARKALPKDKKEVLALAKETYKDARSGGRNLAAGPASVCAQEVIDWLTSNVPYNHEGDARWRWQAVLDYEINRPTWRSLEIPVRAGDVRKRFVWTDDRCTLAFPLFSTDSGRANRSPTVRLEVGKFSRGTRRLLREIADGKRKLRDSSIQERDGKWYFVMAYDVPTVVHAWDDSVTLTLLPSPPDATRPFVCILPDGRKWWLGDGLPLEREYQRVVARRKAIQYRYRNGQGAGHGRERFYQATRPDSRAWTDMQRLFSWNLIADLVRLCERHGAGSLLYREPTMPVRQHCWFSQRGMPFDWSGLNGKLTHASKKHGFGLAVSRIGMKEYRADEEEVKA